MSSVEFDNDNELVVVAFGMQLLSNVTGHQRLKRFQHPAYYQYNNGVITDIISPHL